MGFNLDAPVPSSESREMQPMLETLMLSCHRACWSWILSYVVVRPRHCCFPLGADEERSKTDGAQTAEMENTEERAV